MIVTCERCATQFQLDDERVPDDGVRVRCSRCKHAFFIERPTRTESERIHRVAERALEDPEIPDVAHDLPSDAAPSLGDAGYDASSDSGSSGRWADEEADWQFNVDGSPGEGPEGMASSTSNEVDSDAEDELVARDTDFETDDVPGNTGGDEAAGGWDDAPLLSDLDEDEGSGLDLAPDSDPAVAREADEDPWPRLPTPAATQPESAHPPLVAQAPDPIEGLEGPTSSLVRMGEQDADELGGPDEWNLFGDEASEVSGPGRSRASARRIRAVPSPTRRSVAAGPAERSRALPRGLQRVGRALGWLVAIGLFGVGLHGGLAGAGRPVAEGSTKVDIGSLRIENVSGHWIENLVAGPLFVVSGVVEHAGAGSAPRLLVELLDAEGRRLESAPVFAGPALSARALREEDPRSLQRVQEGRRLSAAPWIAGESRPFHAIVTGVPLEASWFRFAPATASDAPSLPTSSATASAHPGPGESAPKAALSASDPPATGS